MKRILSLLAAVALLCGREVLAQETVEIRYTKGGVSHTVEVNRNIRQLDLYHSGLTSITLPEGLTNLTGLLLINNQLTNLIFPEGLTSLEVLHLSNNQLTDFTFLEGLMNLWRLDLSDNQLTNFTLPEGLASLKSLLLYNNQLTSLTLPEGLANLTSLGLRGNQLTSLRLAENTAERFAGIGADRSLAYNLRVWCENVPLEKVILPKRLEGKVFFFEMEDDVYNNLEFLFLEDLDLRSPRITRAEDALEITWAVGVLQTSANIEGPWKDVRASSPLRIFPRPSLPAEFFRVRVE